MQDIRVLQRFLQYVTGLSVVYGMETEEHFQEVEREHCFSPQAQPLLTATGLKSSVSYMKPGFLYEAEDLLGMSLISFLFKERSFYVGPFVTAEWEDNRNHARLVEAGLSASYLLPYKLYYCSYGVIDQVSIIRIVTGAIASLLPEVPPYSLQRFPETIGHQHPDIFTEEPLGFNKAIKNYELENQFIAMIEEGRTGAALDILDRMGRAPRVEELSSAEYWSTVANATALRTIARKAAERGGVHPAVVDAIAISYAQKMYMANCRDEMMRIIPMMIQEFSDAVNAAQRQKYSPVVRTAVNYIKLHISQEVDIRQLAEISGCTASYLSRRFKAETEMPLTQYLARERCRTAAALLAQTDLPIHDISAHVGYLDNNYFVKVFKQQMGVTPSTYRRRFRCVTSPQKNKKI